MALIEWRYRLSSRNSNCDSLVKLTSRIDSLCPTSDNLNGAEKTFLNAYKDQGESRAGDHSLDKAKHRARPIGPLGSYAERAVLMLCMKG
jgi:hypothetical protein